MKCRDQSHRKSLFICFATMAYFFIDFGWRINHKILLRILEGVVKAAVKAIRSGLTSLNIDKLGAAASLNGIGGGYYGEQPVLIIYGSIDGHRHFNRESVD